jgi:S-DNA-T family DNA segregation ATPase FtsK/SpoIIIE
MSTRKPRATTKSKEPPPPPKPMFRLDPDRLEEIVAILVIILAVLTALGAFNLSGGFLLSTWTSLLQALLGWGVYVAPLLLLGLGIWLILDALDKTWTIGWERPIGVGLLYFLLLTFLHWVARFDDPLKQPGAFQGGGFIGWTLSSLLINAFGEVGAFLAMIAGFGIALILLFNISLPEFARRVVYLFRVMRNLPQEIRQFGKKPAPPPQPPAFPTINTSRTSSAAPSMPRTKREPAPPPPPDYPPIPSTRAAFVSEEPELPAPPPARPVAARIIGGNASPTAAPVIQREWRLPDFTQILEESAEGEINQDEIRGRVHKIEETLAHFGVPAKVLEVNQGPTITQFGVEPGFVEQKGPDGKTHRVKVKVSRISALQHDLELALAAAPIRIEAPIPGKSMVGIEVPNSQIAMVSLRGVMESENFRQIKSKLKIALGQDVAGQPMCDDLAKMPHLLIAGATGSGKSVCVNAIIAGLLCTTTPDEVQFVMIDPKRVELVNFNGIPHLRQPVVVDMDQAVAALQGAVLEMDRRFKIFAQKSARNIDIYHHMIEGKPDAEKLPFLIVIVDELADLMMISPEEVEKAITRLAQMARATGIHLVLATQRPSVDVVTGLIKANFPSRISFAVTSQVDSRVVLDTPGAEKLLGRGDMLYMASDSAKLLRLQGCFVSDRELEKLVAYWKDFAPPALPTPERETAEPENQFVQEMLWNGAAPKKTAEGEDDLWAQAVEIVKQSKRASASLLQRKLKIGYSRAARLMELLEEKGIVGPDEGPTKGRAVIAHEDTLTSSTKSRASTSSARQFEEDDFADWTDEDWADLDKE